MLRSAFNYFAAEANSAAESVFEDDPLINSVVDVGGIRVRGKRKIGEGGFAIVYQVVNEANPNQELALKRLLAADAEKRDLIVQEIAFLKNLSPCKNVLDFIEAANKEAEFLVLTEFCPGKSLYDILVNRSTPFPPETVGRILFQTLEAVAFMHRKRISHRDLKPENLLIDVDGNIKLCDFGSATTKTFEPDETWNMQRRTAMAEEVAKFTTPMFRAPEMVDEWSNFKVDEAVDVWALGCVLFQLCFHTHPFEDGAKLRIVNGNYAIPETDVVYGAFHDLIRQMLAVDPSWRPKTEQVQQHLGEIGVVNNWNLEAAIDFEVAVLPEPKMTPSSTTESLNLPSSSTPEAPPSNSASASALSALNTFKGGAGSMFKNIREQSKAVVSSLLAPKDADFDLITSKVAVMSFPSEGIDLTYKNQIDEIRLILEARQADHYAVINSCERKYSAGRFPRGRLIDAGWSAQVPPTAEQVLNVAMQALEFLGQHKRNVVAIHCLDGRSNSAVLVAALFLVCRIFNKYRDALKLFEVRRSEPILSHGQRIVLKQVEKLVKSGPSVRIPRQAILVNSVILEPVPLFTKAGDGVRPFIDVLVDGKLVGSTLVDYSQLKMFTPYDGEVVINAGGIKAPAGDVCVVVYHARQSLGSNFFGGSGKTERIRICQVYFDPAALTPSKTHVRFATHEIDGISDLSRIPGDFSVSVNFSKKESATTTKFPYLLNRKWLKR